EFKVLINPSTSSGQVQGEEYTNDRIVTLSLNGGPDTKRMAISENADFYGAGQEAYQTARTWTLTEGEEEKTIYVKFYTQWGRASEVVSDTIILKTPFKKPITEMTVGELKEKIAEILAEIAQLKQLLEKKVLEIPVDYKFPVDLKYDQRGDDVRYLQLFLKAQGNEIYPEAIISGWFGPLTKKAVIRFQEKYAEDILTPLGLAKGTGYVGKTTRAKINKILSR
ncbi:MAG: peptidoglycan-binding domain-containing protein, partial [Minisyncoccales bacterium]